MKYFHTKGIDLSRFMLGTVQLGMTYGLGADRAKPSKEKAFSILDRAIDLGLNALDTANNYGDAEQVIGLWLRERRGKAAAVPWTVTKIGPLRHGSFNILRDEILRQVEGCLENLGTDTLDCLMLHNFEDYMEDRDAIQKIFAELHAQKTYKYSAISAYSRHDYSVIAESGFDAVQIPLNLFDWRQIENGGIEKLANAGMLIFARSVFLQGLIFHTPQDLDPRMDFCVPVLDRFHQLCWEFSLSPAVLALSFVLSVPGVTAVVLGCDNIMQLEENAALFDQAIQLSQTQWQAIHDTFLFVDDRVIDPGKWYNHT